MTALLRFRSIRRVGEISRQAPAEIRAPRAPAHPQAMEARAQ